MTRVKLCGITRDEDAIFINELKPEYVGFVFWENSHRYVNMETAAKLRRLIDDEIKTVGVFVDSTAEYIKELHRAGVIQIAQLHGNETADMIRLLQSEGIQVIKAYKVSCDEDVIRACESNADYIMFDPGRGDGKTFSWELIKDVKRPFFLAGGLTSENVQEAVQYVHPFAVDVSSGIETDRKKDKNKMRSFVEKARKASL